MYKLKNRRTGEILNATYKTYKAAQRAKDRKDNEYGAYVHSIIEIA